MLYKILFFYLIAINLITFTMFGIDKINAIRGNWRTKETTLLGLSLIGGSLGGLFAMGMFRHKIRKTPFAVGVPVMLVIHIILLYFLFH